MSRRGSSTWRSKYDGDQRRRDAHRKLGKPFVSNTQIVLNSAGKKLTSAEEEVLFTMLVRARGTVRTLEAKKTKRTRGEASQLGIARSQVEQCREQIVQSYLPMVAKFCQKYVGAYASQDDLLSEGLYRLLLCINNFNPKRGFRFSTYLCRALTNAFFRLIMRERNQQLGRITDEAEDEQPILDAMAADEVEYDESMDLHDILDKNRADLSELETAVVRLSYGIGSEEGPKTMHEIHLIVGLTKGRVQQVHAAAVEKLRMVLQEAQNEVERATIQSQTDLSSRTRV